MFFTKKKEAALEDRISDRFYSAFKIMLDNLVKRVSNIDERAAGCDKKLDKLSSSTNERLRKLEYLFKDEIAKKEKIRLTAVREAQAKERRER